MKAMVLVIISWESEWNLVAIEDPLPFNVSSLFLKEKKEAVYSVDLEMHVPKEKKQT